MPWKIEKRDAKFCVIQSMTDKVEGCHPTQSEAADHMKALYASESAQGMVTGPETPLTVVETEHGPSRWAGVLAVEGEPTGDGRMVERGALSWPDPADHVLPLMFMVETPDGGLGGSPHGGARLAGRITRIWRDGDRIMGEGVFDLGIDGTEAARLLGDGMLSGVSIDPDQVSQMNVEVRCTSEGADGECLDEMLVFKSMRIRGATLAPFQAILNARIELVTDTVEATVASAVTHLASVRDPLLVPPREWFDDPTLDRLTPMTITPDGRIYGHLGPANLCHTGYAETCRVIPDSPSGYAFFHTGARLVACCGDCEPESLAVGCITFGGLHAPTLGTEEEIRRHHEDVSTVVAHVRAGKDAFGVWLAGALVPGLTEEDLVLLRGAKLSGHWSPVNGRNELRIAHAVNNPGYPVPRLEAIVAGGEVLGLVAGGRPIVMGEDPPARPAPVEMVMDVAILDRVIDAFEARITERISALEAHLVTVTDRTEDLLALDTAEQITVLRDRMLAPPAPTF